MKSRWWYVVLGASLALNAGVLGVFVVRRVHEHKSSRWMERTWGRGPTERLRSLFEEHRPEMDSLHQEEMLVRRKLGDFVELEDLDSAQVERWLNEMSRLHETRNRLVLGATREFYRSLEPEAREQFLKRTRRTFAKGHSRFPHGGHRRGRRGPRLGPGGPSEERSPFPPDECPPEGMPPDMDPFGGE